MLPRADAAATVFVMPLQKHLKSLCCDCNCLCTLDQSNDLVWTKMQNNLLRLIGAHFILIVELGSSEVRSEGLDLANKSLLFSVSRG